MERPEVEGLRWTTPEQWHVTLRFLGMENPERAREALAGSAASLRSLAPVVARAGPATIVLGPVLCLPVDGLDALAAEVARSTAGVGGPAETRSFRGHLTLARSRGRGGPTGSGARGNFGAGSGPACALRGLSGRRLSFSWVVREVALVSSETRREGARYREVASVALG